MNLQLCVFGPPCAVCVDRDNVTTCELFETICTMAQNWHLQVLINAYINQRTVV